MLITKAILDRIATGEVDLQFRKWRRPTVKAGGTLRTSVGMLDITEVTRTTMSAITVGQAHRAGYATKAALLDQLRSRTEGDVYRIGVRPGGMDPLIALRESSDLDDVDMAELDRRLTRLDDASPTGPWTRRYLDLIAAHPHVRAEDLATSLGLTKPPFKANVRKLKALGLTISHSPGYEISPRGRAYLDATATD